MQIGQISKLRLHGARVIRDVGIMIEHVKAENCDELMLKIKEVNKKYTMMSGHATLVIILLCK